MCRGTKQPKPPPHKRTNCVHKYSRARYTCFAFRFESRAKPFHAGQVRSKCIQPEVYVRVGLGGGWRGKANTNHHARLIVNVYIWLVIKWPMNWIYYFLELYREGCSGSAWYGKSFICKWRSAHINKLVGKIINSTTVNKTQINI